MVYWRCTRIEDLRPKQKGWEPGELTICAAWFAGRLSGSTPFPPPSSPFSFPRALLPTPTKGRIRELLVSEIIAHLCFLLRMIPACSASHDDDFTTDMTSIPAFMYLRG